MERIISYTAPGSLQINAAIVLLIIQLKTGDLGIGSPVRTMVGYAPGQARRELFAFFLLGPDDIRELPLDPFPEAGLFS